MEFNSFEKFELQKTPKDLMNTTIKIKNQKAKNGNLENQFI